ncbi:MAG: 3-dehydroquinate dehydratase [Clostridiales bacterium]|nr:3-dehydroquinate dehydratase [Clostridiales bacterium]
MKLLILNGPNLNMTGFREPEIYGARTMDEIIKDLSVRSEKLGIGIDHVITNYEGKLIDELQTAHERYDGVLLNAGALTHYSYALRDAIAACRIPVGEIHMSDILARESFRANDVIFDVCAFRVMGLGEESYFRGVEEMAKLLI